MFQKIFTFLWQLSTSSHLYKYPNTVAAKILNFNTKVRNVDDVYWSPIKAWELVRHAISSNLSDFTYEMWFPLISLGSMISGMQV